jgi:hypothetical protein
VIQPPSHSFIPYGIYAYIDILESESQSSIALLINPRMTSTTYDILDLEPRDGVVSNEPLVVSSFLSRYYNNFQKKADFLLLRGACERKLDQLYRKVHKMRTDFEQQLVDAE